MAQAKGPAMHTLGYLPTVEHRKLGGYETWRARSSSLEVEAAPKIMDQLLRLFDGLKEEH